MSLTSADIADALVTSPNQLLVNGKMPGTISMFVWDRGGALRRYEVVVQRDLAQLAEQMRQLFPGEAIEVQSNGKNIVLSGTVSSKDVIEKAVNVAAGYVEKQDEVVNLLQIAAGRSAEQPGAAARALRRGQPQRDDRARRVALHGERRQERRWIGRTTTQFSVPASAVATDGRQARSSATS